MKLNFLTLCLTGLLTLTPGAQATTVTPLSLTEQAKKAEVVLRGTLGAAQVVKEGDLTYLAYPLTVSEVIAGEVANLPQLEGKPALFFLQGVQDLPVLREKQEATMLLYTGKFDSPLLGFNQGWYPIVDGKIVPPEAGKGDAASAAAAAALTDPNQLRDAIRAARGAK